MTQPSEQEPVEAGAKQPSGLPPWMATFADLMTLLMCFFVLMLSFSEMDVAKFKQLSGSMREAFGVQADIDVRTIPKGTSLIAREFSPGRPEPTVLDSVRQFTINSSFNTLDVQRDLEAGAEREESAVEQRAEVLREALAEEIDAGRLVVRVEDQQVIVQILERDSFRSGFAELEADFEPTLEKIGVVLADISGAITVAGHTDSLPIATSRFRSNWDLSAARAASVVHGLLDAGVDASRLMITGHADTQPRAQNDTPESRALNRRIDITLLADRDRHGRWVPTAPSIDAAAAPDRIAEDLRRLEGAP